MVGGPGASSLNFGELWHFFERELGCPLSVLDAQQLSSADFNKYNTIILPSGNYNGLGDAATHKLDAWITAGGKLIAIEAAVGFLSGKEGFGVTQFLTDVTANIALPYKASY
ncbi:hypothetical protein [Parapedobacter tibetensis]|uniref:hypothetical protein n=1 Tax=Parapedobacter tibetensis TaxID=2972951 RepID=UPI00214D1951|nr:hypothetical protein [Parapedobacter tibetensis]